MNCQQAKELFPEYLMGSRTTEMQAHLEGCVACRAEAAELTAVWEKLGRIEEEPPSEALRTNFYAMLQGYRRGLENASARPAPEWNFVASNWFGVLMRRPAFQGAMAVLLLAAGVFAGHRWQSAPAVDGAQSQVAELRAELRDTQKLVTMSLLQQQSASERLEGVSWSQRAGHPDPEVLTALLQVMRHDPSVNVRLAALDALRPLAKQAPYADQVKNSLVQELGRSAASPMVQISMIDFVVDAKEKRAAEILSRMTSDQKLNQAVRERAAWGLQQLNTGGPR